MKIKEMKSLLAGISFLWFASLSGAAAGAENQFGELTRLADQYGTDKGSAVHHYTEVYEYFFYPIKNEARRIFEIGIADGASMKMWKDYFPHAVIYGIDIIDMSSLNSDSIKTYVADQADRKKLQGFIDAHPGDFDIILDDGGHTMEQQQISFGYLFKYVKPSGYYVIEDVHTSFMGASYGAEKGGFNTTINMINKFIWDGKIRSKYMTRAEARYLSDHIDYCVLFCRKTGKTPKDQINSISCLFKKK